LSRSKHLKNDFINALRGIRNALARERNLRIHFVAAIIVLASCLLLSLSAVKTALLVLLIVLVVSLELINTALEKTIDLISPDYNEQAGFIKDVAAAAVLISAIGAVIIGILILGEPLVKFLSGLWL